MRTAATSPTEKGKASIIILKPSSALKEKYVFSLFFTFLSVSCSYSPLRDITPNCQTPGDVEQACPLEVQGVLSRLYEILKSSMISSNWHLWSREMKESEKCSVLGFVSKVCWCLLQLKHPVPAVLPLKVSGERAPAQRVHVSLFKKCALGCLWKIECYQPVKESVSSSGFNLILIHLRKPTCVFTAGLSLFLQCIKTLFLATLRSSQRMSELCGLLSPFTAFLLSLRNPNSFLRRSLSYAPKWLICQYFSLDLTFSEEGCTSVV